MPAPLHTIIDDDWASALDPVAGRRSPRWATSCGPRSPPGRTYLPAGPLVLRAFERPMSQVKVLIVGQDPYPTPGHPIGLSFAVERHVRPVPRSLGNIYKELLADIGIPAPGHGDLTAWSDQGVLLLNRVLTVEPGRPASHRGKGWEPITEAAITALVARGGPLVAVLWGKDAQTLRPLLGRHPVIASAHPSPMSADRGFFGSQAVLPGQRARWSSRAANRSTGRCEPRRARVG